MGVDRTLFYIFIHRFPLQDLSCSVQQGTKVNELPLKNMNMSMLIDKFLMEDSTKLILATPLPLSASRMPALHKMDSFTSEESSQETDVSISRPFIHKTDPPLSVPRMPTLYKMDSFTSEESSQETDESISSPFIHKTDPPLSAPRMPTLRKMDSFTSEESSQETDESTSEPLIRKTDLSLSETPKVHPPQYLIRPGPFPCVLCIYIPPRE